MGKETKHTAVPFPFLDHTAPLADRVRDLVSRLTLDEKLRLMTTRQEAIPRLGVPEFTIFGEAAHGIVAEDGEATVFPQTQGLACTWDEDLLQRIGTAVGTEARAYAQRRNGGGGLCLWAPTIDMERDPRWGRTEESYGEDPLLTGRLAGAYIRGLQGDHPFYLRAVATPKHFYANNNETDRESCSVSLDPRLKREYYLKPYEYVLREAKPLSLMTAYNAIDGVPAMAHPDLQRILRDEWGMEGFIVSDNFAFSLMTERHRYSDSHARAAALAVKAGVDNITDDGPRVAAALREALDNGWLVEADLDRALSRVFAVRLRLGQFDPPQINPYSAIGPAYLQCEPHRVLALEAARKAIVLLKNDPVRGKPLLPLAADGLKKLAVIGPLADVVYRDWYGSPPAGAKTPLKALAARLSPDRIVHEDGSDLVTFRRNDGAYLATTVMTSRPYLTANHAAGELFRKTDWGWGNITLQSLFNSKFITVEETGGVKTSAKEVWGWHVRERFAFEETGAGEEWIIRDYTGRAWGVDERGLVRAILAATEGPVPPDALSPGTAPASFVVETVRDGVQAAAEAAREADAAVVFVGSHPLLVAKEEMDRSDLSLAPDQVRLIEAVLTANPRTVVVITSGYPQALGPLADRIPAWLYTAHGGHEAGAAVAGALLGDFSPAGRLPMTWYAGVAELPDLMHYDITNPGSTYRWYRGQPLFAFGHGLGYADIRYESMDVKPHRPADGDGLSVTVKLSNKSSFYAEEVVQVYGTCLDHSVRRPLKELLAFRRVAIQAGKSVSVALYIDTRQLKRWNPEEDSWTLETAQWKIMAGPASDREALSALLQFTGKKVGSIALSD